MHLSFFKGQTCCLQGVSRFVSDSKRAITEREGEDWERNRKEQIKRRRREEDRKQLHMSDTLSNLETVTEPEHAHLLTLQRRLIDSSSSDCKTVTCQFEEMITTQNFSAAWGGPNLMFVSTCVYCWLMTFVIKLACL